MPTRRNIFRALWPDETTFQNLRLAWVDGATTELLRFTWSGLDALRIKYLDRVGGVRGNDRQIERSITQLLVMEIQKVLPSASPFAVMHEWFEQETLYSNQAQPPQYDICFVLRESQRITIPIEAKLLPTDGRIGEYVKEITENFLTCRYAPLSSEGGMLGYLMKGAPDQAFRNISTAVSCQLNDHPEFKGRNHKVSSHKRKVPPGKQYPSSFKCHHLIFKIS